MTAQFLVHFLNTVKKWLSQLARRSASSFSLFLSLLCRFVSDRLKLSACRRRLFAGIRFSNEALPRSQENIARQDAPICSSSLPLPSSDDPRSRNHSQHPRKNTAIPVSQINTTIRNGGTAEIDRGSISSFHTGESSGSNMSGPFPSGDPLERSGSPGPSRPLGLYGLWESHSRSQTSTNDARSLVARPTASTMHPALGASKHSLTPSFTGLRPHKGHVYHLSNDVHNSMTLQPAPPDLAADHVRYVAPPRSDEMPGSEIEVHQRILPGIFPMVAAGVLRYKRCITRPTDNVLTTVPIMTITFPVHDPSMVLPEGWTTLVHPEGSRYFLNEKQRTFTEVNIFDPQIHKGIEDYMQYLWSGLRSIIKQENRRLDLTQVDLVLELKRNDVAIDNSGIAWYYFVNHNSRCLFWLHESDVEDVLRDCKGIRSLSHIRLAIQAQYWLHWEYFPDLCLVSQDHVDEIKDMLMHATCDHITSKRSSALGDVIELKDYISVVNGLKVHSREKQRMQRCHTAIIIGRIMKLFSENQFTNFHGEDCVRLISDKTVHGWTYTPSLLMVVVAPFLFLDPMTQVQKLHKAFVDETPSTARWNALSLKLKRQLKDSNLLATVLLSVNVGFLDISTVDTGGRSAIQIISYMSLVTSLGSIILGMFLVWHEQTSGDNTALEAASFALKIHDEKHGLEKLAIIYSIPKALLMWGMIFFFVAFSIDWCSSRDITSGAIVGTTVLIVFGMITYGIIRIRERERWWWHAIDQQLSSFRARVMKFLEMIRSQRRKPQSDPEEASSHTLTGLPQANVEVDAPTPRNHQPELPGANGREDHPYSIAETRSYQSNTSVASKNERQAAVNDTGAAVPPSPYYTEYQENAKYADNVVGEPEEVDYSRPSSSTTPYPKIVGRRATDEPFRHAAAAAKWTLQDGQDIEEAED